MQFWVLQDCGLGPDHDRWWTLVLSKRAKAIGEENWCDVFRGKMDPPHQPAPFKVVRGREQGDVLYTDLLGLSFSARMAELLKSIHCTGFLPNPSIIYDRHDHTAVCSDAVWTQFRDGCGPLDYGRGYDPTRPFTRRDAVGLYFEPSTWNGLDLFRPAKSPQVIITDRVARAIQAADVRGCQLVRTQEYGKDMGSALRSICEGPEPLTLPPNKKPS
jgi:hypothetical protein